MDVPSTLRGMGRGARKRASSATHTLKDRSLEKRLERASQDVDRLRFENGLLRDEMAEAKSEHTRLFDLIETRLEGMGGESENNRRSRRGRWLLVLGALGAGAYGWVRMRRPGGDEEWAGDSNDGPSVARSKAAAA